MSERVTIVRGLSAKDSPAPVPEFGLGNRVRLKKPYRGDGDPYQNGIIVEHIGNNAFGMPMVSLHLFDDDGKMYGVRNRETGFLKLIYVDFAASELVVVQVAGQESDVCYPNGFDPYPVCEACGGKTENCFHPAACQACGGWGHVKEMQSLPA